MSDNQPLQDGLSTLRQTARLAGYDERMADVLRLGSYMGFSVAYRPGSSDEGVLAHSFEDDIFLTGVPEYTPQASHVVLDVGAHLGDFCLLLSSRVARVYGVEARRETFALLRINVALNDSRNVIADHLALGAVNGFTELFHAPDGESWGDSTIHDYGQSREAVRAVTLEQYFFERNITHVDFAKFNCEGAEFPILLSASTETLAKIDKMLILYHCDLAAQFEETRLLDKLAQAGFRTTVRNRSDDRGWIIAQKA